MKTWLLDTGPLVAYLDRTDGAHRVVTSCLDDFSGRLVTSSAVITETMHLVSGAPEGPRSLSAFVEAVAIEVYDLCRPPELNDAATLMERYADTPMDFADATLVLLAEGLNVHEIVTLDRRGFSTYRTRRRRGFRILPDRPG